MKNKLRGVEIIFPFLYVLVTLDLVHTTYENMYAKTELRKKLWY